MNQIPNIEKTMRRGIKLIAGRIEALHPQYFLDEKTYKHDVKGTMDVVKGVMADIEETHQQQLQKAREETIHRILAIVSSKQNQFTSTYERGYQDCVKNILESIHHYQSKLDKPN